MDRRKLSVTVTETNNQSGGTHLMDTPNWEGVHNHDRHRTLGPHRAWCECGYCYPDDWCDCCHEAAWHRKVWIDFDGDVVGED